MRFYVTMWLCVEKNLQQSTTHYVMMLYEYPAYEIKTHPDLLHKKIYLLKRVKLFLSIPV